MKLSSFKFVASGTILCLLSCSKTNNISSSKTAIDGYVNIVNTIDSIAKLYGFTRSSDNYASLPRKSLTISEFFILMKNTNASKIEDKITVLGNKKAEPLGSNSTVVPLDITDTSSVVASGLPNYANLSGFGGGIYTAGSLSYSIDYLKSRAYPSVDQITIQINTDGGGLQHVYGIGGSSFVYAGTGSPTPPVQWAYMNRGGSATGTSNALPGFSVICYGTETEVITILGFTYTYVYNVTFRILNQLFAVYQTMATVTLTRVTN